MGERDSTLNCERLPAILQQRVATPSALLSLWRVQAVVDAASKHRKSFEVGFCRAREQIDSAFWNLYNQYNRFFQSRIYTLSAFALSVLIFSSLNPKSYPDATSCALISFLSLE